MHSFIETPIMSDTLFHCRAGGFPLHRCTYVLLDANGNDPPTPKRHAAIRRFFAAVGRCTAEVHS
jgi:hypothetical protein